LGRISLEKIGVDLLRVKGARVAVRMRVVLSSARALEVKTEGIDPIVASPPLENG
jgi:hypothetical protein